MTDILDDLVACCRCGDARAATANDTVDGVDASYVARPSTTKEVAAVLSLAAEHGLSVVARGRGTKLDWGVPPTSAELIVDLSRMDALLEHGAGDFVLRAEAGATLRNLNEAIADTGQWLPLDEVVPGSSLGGLVATGLSGPSRYLHGSVRDLLIGLTVVRADGVVAHAGSKVVKNVAGYDLAKLFTGSYGTLGIITEVIFRLRPLPEARRFVTGVLSDASALAPLLSALLQARVQASAIELERTGGGAVTLCVVLEGREQPTSARAEKVAAIFSQPELSSTPPPGFGVLPGPITVKVTSALASIGSLLGTIDSVSRRLGLDDVVRGSCAAGVLSVGLSATTSPEDLRTFLEVVRSRPLADGSAVVLRAPQPSTALCEVWGPVSGLELMRAVKRQFDPEQRLSPGRFVGGI